MLPADILIAPAADIHVDSDHAVQPSGGGCLRMSGRQDARAC